MIRKLALIILSVAFINVCLLQAQANLCRNGGFENGSPSDWFTWETTNSNSAFTWACDDTHSGIRSGKVINTTVSDCGTWTQYIDNTKWQIGKRYYIECWIKTDNVTSNNPPLLSGAYLSIHCKKSDYSTTIAEYATNTLKSTNNWTKVNCTFFIPDSTQIVQLCCKLYHASGTAWFDDVVMNEVTDLSLNGGFEKGVNNTPSDWFTWKTTNSTSAFTWAYGGAHSGIRSGKVINAAVGDCGTWTQYIDNTKWQIGKRYYIECWIKTDNVTSNNPPLLSGAYLSIHCKKSDYSTTIAEYATNTLKSTNNWTKVNCTFFIPDSTQIVQLCCKLYHASGTAWFDDVVMNEVADLSLNGGFEAATIPNTPDNWLTWQSGNGSTFTWTTSPEAIHSGLHSIKIDNNTTNDCGVWTQYVDENRWQVGGHYYIEGWIYTQNVVCNDHAWCLDGAYISVDCKKADNTLVAEYNTNAIRGTNGWTKASCSFYVPEGSEIVQIGCKLYCAQGRALFDDVIMYNICDNNTNGGFETANESWFSNSISGQSLFNWISPPGYVYKGIHSVQIINNGNSAYGAWSQILDVMNVGATYNYEGYVKVDNADDMNGGFEAGTSLPDNWSTWPPNQPDNFKWVSDSIHSGSRSVKISNGSITDCRTWTRYIDPSKWQVGKQYYVEGWLNSNLTSVRVGTIGNHGTNGAYLSVECKKSDYSIIAAYNSSQINWIGNTGWMKKLFTFVVPPGTNIIQICCKLYNATGVAYFDDVVLRDEDGAYISIDCQDGSNNTLSSFITPVVKGTNDWSRIKGSFVFPTNAVTAQINCNLDSVKGGCWFDDVSITPAEVASVANAANAHQLNGFGAESDPHELVSAAVWDTVKSRLGKMKIQKIRMFIEPNWFEPSNDNADANQINWTGFTFDTVGTGETDIPAIRRRMLFRHLDACQSLGIRVVLTYLATPNWYWMAAPNSLIPNDPEEAAENISAVLQKLNNMGYTCIKEFIFYNEPCGSFKYLSDGAVDFPRYTICFRAVNARLQADGIRSKIKLVGSDDWGDLSWYTNVKNNLDDVIDLYDSHSYTSNINDIDVEEKISSFVHDRTSIISKPFFLGEFGTNMVDWFKMSDTATYDRALYLPFCAINTLNNCGSGALVWTLYDQTYSAGEPMLTGLWDKNLHIRPEYHSWALVNKYTRLNSDIFPITNTPNNVNAVALRSPEGKWSYLIVNRSSNPISFNISNPNMSSGYLCKYVFSPSTIPPNSNVIGTSANVSYNGGLLNISLPEKSFIVLSDLDS